MKCLETRRRHGMRWRRYRTPEGATRTTYEVPEAALRGLGMSKVIAAVAAANRGEALREQAARLRAAVLARAGVKATAVAHELDCTEARVRQIRASRAA